MFDVHLAQLLLIITFAIGYIAIIVEANVKINKAAPAILMAVLTWMFLFLIEKSEWTENIGHLSESVGEISQIIYFLIGAMAIVELIDSHKGFKIITDLIQTSSKKKLLWLIGFISFFLSAVLDNLTSTIVIVSMLRKLITDTEDRMRLGAVVVIAANAGGAWTPIGDVTTTMLWIKGNITTLAIMKALFLPSLISLIVALLIFGIGLKGRYPNIVRRAHEEAPEPGARIIFFVGIGALIFVPIFKTLTGLPPFMGVLIGLGVLWLITDLLHSEAETRKHLKISHILTKIDISGVLFFLGILLCINALNTAGLLRMLADFLSRTLNNVTLIATLIGMASAVVDNVPLVAAGIGMYDLQTYPVDSYFWQLLAYCAGTGGSILVIGSAAGVAFMSLEKVSFYWYLRKAGWIAFLSYLAGIMMYLLQDLIHLIS
ncbi:MAG TPA: sodium:proton antiporter NhaD [Chlamydiales bacterium]|nr:sodium:proton antiporter NhaD [Chlamydiales bacterium]